MANIYEVQLPIVGQPQTFTATLGSKSYQMTLLYRDIDEGGWTLDIADTAGNPIVSGLPLVTGCNLLAQYKHLGFGVGLYVQTTSDPDAVPTFENLGGDALLYCVTP
jgi:hypothetical protein